MNKQELLAAAEVMMRAGEGEVVESKPKDNIGWTEATCPTWDWNKCGYRILDFPPPPSGQSWHNPAGLNATQVGVSEGWRLLLQSEANIRDKDALKCEFYAGSFQRWIESGEKSELVGTYRTKSPLPITDPIVPIQTEESWIKENCRKTFPDSWNMTILQIWEAGYKADKEQDSNQKDSNQKDKNQKYNNKDKS